jgi:putative oxidoreductase
METGLMNKYLGFIARILLAQVYLIVGFYSHIYQSITNPSFYDNFQIYLGIFGLPGIFAPLMILVEITGSVLLVLGWKTRLSALLLAGYSLFIALVFHHNLANPQEMLSCLQYLAVTGAYCWLPAAALLLTAWII